MSISSQSADSSPPETVSASDLAEANRLLQVALEQAQGEIAQLKAQLDWFKQQLFGSKSERRLIVSPDQQPLEFG